MRSIKFVDSLSLRFRSDVSVTFQRPLRIVAGTGVAFRRVWSCSLDRWLGIGTSVSTSSIISRVALVYVPRFLSAVRIGLGILLRTPTASSGLIQVVILYSVSPLARHVPAFSLSLTGPNAADESLARSVCQLGLKKFPSVRGGGGRDRFSPP